MSEETVAVPKTLLEDLLDNTYELKGVRDWWKDEPRRRYSEDYARYEKNILEAEQLLKATSGPKWKWIEDNPRKALRMVGVSFRTQDEAEHLSVHVVDEDPRYPLMCVNGDLVFGVYIDSESGMPKDQRVCICGVRYDGMCFCDL